MNINEIYQTIYPLTITKDRYSGTYSGGYFTAWNLDPDQIPYEIACDDTSAMVVFNLIHRGTLDLAYGVGATPDEAATDLYNKLQE